MASFFYFLEEWVRRFNAWEIITIRTIRVQKVPGDMVVRVAREDVSLHLGPRRVLERIGRFWVTSLNRVI